MNHHRSKSCMLVSVAFALSISLSTVTANDLTVFDEVYFPIIKDGPHDATGPYAGRIWNNWVSIMSADLSVPANIMFILYQEDGTWEHLSSTRTSIDGRLTYTPNLLLYDAKDIEAFDGTLVIAADRPVVAQINQIEPNEEAFMMYQSPRVRGDTLIFSQAYDNYVAGTGFQNILYVQNLNEVPVEIKVSYQDDWLGTVVDRYTIPVGGQYVRNPREVTGDLYLWSRINFNGTITVSIENCEAPDPKIAGLLYAEYILYNKLKSSTIYGATTAQTEFYFPYITDSVGQSANYISIYNPSNAQVSCRIEFYTVEGDTGSGPACIAGHVTGDDFVLIEPGERITTTASWACYGDLEHDFEGSMLARCSAPVHSATNAVTWDADMNGIRYDQHEAVIGRNQLLFPSVFDNEQGYINTAHILNPNDFPITLDISLFHITGEPLGSDTQILGPYAKTVFRPYMMNETSYFTGGHMVITVRDGQQATGVLVYEKPQFIDISPPANPMGD